MATIASFTFNPFQENTFVIYDDTKECIIIDPGCYEQHEKDQLEDFITQKELTPVKLINTHCHIDHICGNKFISEKYSLELEGNELEIPILDRAAVYGATFGFNIEESPSMMKILNEGDVVSFGNTELEVLLTPGHSPGSISFYNRKDKTIIAGDVLFLQSIGRTDLPGGDYLTLMQSIDEKLMSLDDDVTVYCGHGPSTKIGDERRSNPFILEYYVTNS